MVNTIQLEDLSIIHTRQVAPLITDPPVTHLTPFKTQSLCHPPALNHQHLLINGKILEKEKKSECHKRGNILSKGQHPISNLFRRFYLPTSIIMLTIAKSANVYTIPSFQCQNYFIQK